MPKLLRSTIFLLIINFLPVFPAVAQTMDWSKKANPLFNAINGIAFRADGQKLVCGTNCHPASIRIFDIATSDLEWDYTVGSDFMCIMGVAISTNNSYIAAIEEFGNIFIFDNTGSRPVIRDTVKTGAPYGFCTAISPDNTQLAVGCSNGKIQLYTIENSMLQSNINAHASWVTTVAYSADGKYIASGGSDNKVKIWTSAGALLFTGLGHTNDITSVVFHPNNQELVSSSRDGNIIIWDISTGKAIQTIPAHSDDVSDIDISPDGSKIASASSDCTAKIWDYTTGKHLSTFGVADSGSLNAIAWSPNGDQIATGNIKSDLVLWNIPATLSTGKDLKTPFLSIYPNPCTDKITIRFQLQNQPVHLTIYNHLGQVVTQINNIRPNSETIDTKSFTNGIYTVKMDQSNQSFVEKFVVCH